MEFLIGNLTESQVVVRTLCSVVCAVLVAYITGKIIGPANKAAWFRKREKFSFFLKRGFIGEGCHFGYPCKKQGFIVSAAMLVVDAILIFTIFKM